MQIHSVSESGCVQGTAPEEDPDVRGGGKVAEGRRVVKGADYASDEEEPLHHQVIHHIKGDLLHSGCRTEQFLDDARVRTTHSMKKSLCTNRCSSRFRVEG